MSQYTARYYPKGLILGEGQTVIVTGWLPKKAIAKQLLPSQYAAVGNLYSRTRGISPLIRNLLLNPQIRLLLALGITKEDKNSGSIACLMDFFRQGFTEGVSPLGRKVWVINSPVPGYIDIEIPAEALESLRSTIHFIQCHSKDDVLAQARDAARLPILRELRLPREFPYTPPKSGAFEGDPYGHRVEAETVAETWVKILHRVRTIGTVRPSSYDNKWQEIIDLTSVVTNEPKDFYFPDPNFLPLDRESLKAYIPHILYDHKSSGEDEEVEYTYGQRLRSWFGVDQVEQVIEKLCRDINSASAVMSLWDIRDHSPGGSPPCLNHIWVRVVKKGGSRELSMSATFRSNDMFSAWPANAMGLSALQRHIRTQIGFRLAKKGTLLEPVGDALRLGPLIVVSKSAHIYDDCWEAADQVIAEQYKAIASKVSYDDPVGNFVIDVQDGKILVTHLSPSGEEVSQFTGTNPLQILREVHDSVPTIQGKHIGYLGIELQKAASSIETGGCYHQGK